MTGNILGIVTLTFLLENPQSKNKIYTTREDCKRIEKIPFESKIYLLHDMANQLIWYVFIRNISMIS